MNNQEKTDFTDPLKQQGERNTKPTNTLFTAGEKQSANPNPTGGPQFNKGGKGGWGEKIKGWLNKYGSSVILPVIAILILAGGIYLYTNQRDKTADMPNETANIEGKLADIQEGESTDSQTEEQTAQEDTEQEEGVKEIVPEARKEGGNIIEKAARGDGVTHLARRALQDYLEENPQDQELTKEHMIYVEDYLKDKVGSKSLEVGEEVSFSEDSIQEAINSSFELTDNQLQNLEKYSSMVNWQK